MLIATDRGNIPVEDLVEGDKVWTPDKRLVPIVAVHKSEIVGTADTVPCRIPVGFFGENIPNAEVLISPHHAIFDARNGKWDLPRWIQPSLDREESMIGERFMYYHVALPDYNLDKMMCQWLPVDSWDQSKEMEY
jgi:hypothetical protein